MITHGDQIIMPDIDDDELSDAEHETIISTGQRLFSEAAGDRAQMFALLRAAALVVASAAVVDDDPRGAIASMAEDIAQDAEGIWLVALAQTAEQSAPHN